MDNAFKKIISKLGMSKIDVNEKDIALENKEGRNFLKTL